MLKAVLIGSAVLISATIPARAQQPAGCLHGNNETPADHARRQQAVQYAVKVNLAESTIVGPSQFRQKYRPLTELVNLPALPAGFAVDFHNDDQGYLFSLKDTRDPCHYAVFSDQDRLVYEALPRSGGLTIPLASLAPSPR